MRNLKPGLAEAEWRNEMRVGPWDEPERRPGGIRLALALSAIMWAIMGAAFWYFL
jgi:hypothetical protein